MLTACKKDLSPVNGCTDVTSINYNPNAVIDDGSCINTTPLNINTPLGFPNMDIPTNNPITNSPVTKNVTNAVAIVEIILHVNALSICLFLDGIPICYFSINFFK